MLLVLAYPLRPEATLVRMTQFLFPRCFSQRGPIFAHCRPALAKPIHENYLLNCGHTKQFRLYYEPLVQTTYPCAGPRPDGHCYFRESDMALRSVLSSEPVLIPAEPNATTGLTDQTAWSNLGRLRALTGKHLAGVKTTAKRAAQLLSIRTLLHPRYQPPPIAPYCSLV